MVRINAALFGVFLFSCAWQDIRRKSIAIWVCWLFGCLALFVRICDRTGSLFQSGMGKGWTEILCGMAIGGILLLVSHFTEGAIGDGDGWFFLVSGIYLGFWNNLEFLLYGLLICAGYCLCIMAKGIATGTSVRKRVVPFLPFLVPIGLWLVVW